MNLKMLLITCLVLPVLISCQMLKNRKPQSTGSTAYCSNCLMEEVDSDIKDLKKIIKVSNPQLAKNQVVKTPVPVRSAVVFNKEGNPVCRVDFSEYPDLVPSALQKPVSDNLVHYTKKHKRGLASVENDLPECSGKYLSMLKKIAIDNVVVNSDDKSHIHKTGAATTGRAVIGASICFLSGGIPFFMDKEKSYPTAGTAIAGTTGVVSSGSAVHQSRKLKKAVVVIEDILSKGWRKKHYDKLSKVQRNKLLSLAVAIGSFCYLGAEGSIAVYESM